MSSTILNRWKVYYAADGGTAGQGYKQIKWDDSITYPPETNTNTVNELYSALMDLFSVSTQNDALDTTPMRAITPSVYEIGSFDAGDLEPWFIDADSVKHLTGGSISTANWTRDTTARTGSRGIVQLTVSSSNIVDGDVGATISNGTNDGYLLDVDGSNIWIRPTASTSDDDWTSVSGTITCNSHTATYVSSQASAERIWSNIYSIGSIYSGTQLYVTQAYSTFTPWWGTGHLDRLFLTYDDYGVGLIDYGYLTVFAREYAYLFDHFTADLSGGGRSPIPLATSSDINNDTAIGTISALTGITFIFGDVLKDISNGNGNRPYDVEINCGGYSIKNFYEYTKYVSRRSATTPLSTSLYQGGSPAWGRNGEQYLGAGEIVINLASISVSLAEGDTITGGNSGATGVLVSEHTSPTNFLIVKEVRGTFQDNETITDSGSGSVTTAASGAVESITLSKTAPFGTFAGGQFFGARGVYIYNMAGGDSNNYSLIDSTGTTQNPPATIGITVNNTLSGDRVSVFRAINTNGTIENDYLTSHATNNVAGDTTFDVDAGTPIPTDTPTSGVLRIIDQPGLADHRYRYSSWTGSTFTLVTTGIPTGTIDSPGTNPANSFRATSANLANVLPGDMVRNSTDNSWGHVRTITLVSGNTYDITHTPLTSGTNNYWTASDNYQFNTLVETYNGSDKGYVPYIDKTATSTTTSVSVQYDTTHNIVTRVRRKGMQPYNNYADSLTSSGYTTSVTRIPDDIVT